VFIHLQGLVVCSVALHDRKHFVMLGLKDSFKQLQRQELGFLVPKGACTSREISNATLTLSLSRKLSAAATSVPPKKSAHSRSLSPKASAKESASMPQKVLFGKKNTKQTALNFKKVSVEQYKEENLRAFEAVRMNAKSMQQQAALEKQCQEDKKQEQGAKRLRRFYWKAQGGRPSSLENEGEESETSKTGGRKKKTVCKLVRAGGLMFTRRELTCGPVQIDA
jgi:hypothetical protein